MREGFTAKLLRCLLTLLRIKARRAWLAYGRAGAMLMPTSSKMTRSSCGHKRILARTDYEPDQRLAPTWHSPLL